MLPVERSNKIRFQERFGLEVFSSAMPFGRTSGLMLLGPEATASCASSTVTPSIPGAVAGAARSQALRQLQRFAARSPFSTRTTWSIMCSDIEYAEAKPAARGALLAAVFPVSLSADQEISMRIHYDGSAAGH